MIHHTRYVLVFFSLAGCTGYFFYYQKNEPWWSVIYTKARRKEIMMLAWVVGPALYHKAEYYSSIKEATLLLERGPDAGQKVKFFW